MEAWTGFGFTNNFYGGYFGFSRALNPTQNLWIDGFVIRADGSVGHYDYRQGSGTIPNPQVETDAADLMFGYRKILGVATVTGWLGVNYEHHNNPDPTASIRGTKAGAKVLGEIYTPVVNGAGYFYGQGWYSSAFDSWSVYGSLPFKVIQTRTWMAERVWVGPEGGASGNNAPYREARAGAIVRFENVLGYFGTNFLVSGGYRTPLTPNSPDGYYVNFHLGHEFR